MTVIAANAGRYPVSAQCEILGVPRSTYYAMRGRAEPAEAPDPAAEEVAAAFEESRGRYGARKIKASLARMGIVLSRRRIGRIMKGKGLISVYADAKFKPSRSNADEADAPNIVNREFDGRAPRTHVVSDLAYVRMEARWCYVCLLIDPCNREIVGHAAGERKDAGLVKSAFATLSVPLDGIEVFRTDRGPEFNSAAIDELLDVFEIKRSLSAKGCPYDNSVDESTNKIPKAEFVYRERFSTLRELQAKLSDYVNWYNNFRLHSTLGYMSPVEFRLAGPALWVKRPRRCCQSKEPPSSTSRRPLPWRDCAFTRDFVQWEVRYESGRNGEVYREYSSKNVHEIAIC